MFFFLANNKIEEKTTTKSQALVCSQFIHSYKHLLFIKTTVL